MLKVRKYNENLLCEFRASVKINNYTQDGLQRGIKRPCFNLTLLRVGL
ncbi:hypothetical protein NIES4075_56590 [Tolypothrix sp. NIES-4075]|nr:hypothetical protein NIES4075_56590 [Tolypothrix sp. NIES-4075]